MFTKKRLAVGAAGITAAAMLFGGGMAFGSASNPTQDEANSALNTLQLFVQQRPDAAPTTPPPASPTATTPPPTTSVGSSLPQGVTATPGDGTITLHWSAPTNTTGLTGYAYGRDGTDTTGFGAYDSPVQPTTTSQEVLDKLTNGTAYHVYVAAVYADGSTTANRVTLAATPVASAPSASPTTPTATPTNGSTLSGLAWKSGVWAKDTGTAASFAASRGKPLDVVEVFPSRDSFSAMGNTWWNGDNIPPNFVANGGHFVISVPMWPDDHSVSSPGTQAQWTAFFNVVKGIDPGAALRLGWEMNCDCNNWGATSSNATQWEADFNSVAGWAKAVSPAFQIVFNPNAGAKAPDRIDDRVVFAQVKQNVQAYAYDDYDWFPGVGTSDNQNNISGSRYLVAGEAYAAQQGVKFDLPEWGISCNSGANCSAAGNAQGDDPNYIHDVLANLKANASIIGFDSYFDEDADYIRAALYRNPIGPLSGAKYKADLAS